MHVAEKILIVDDTFENIRVLANILTEEGMEVEYSTSGKNAIKLAEKTKFILILLDIMMPELDGYETCKIIKKIPAYKDVPIIFLTAKTDPESIVKGFNVGSVDYITKPFNRDELLVRINNHISLKKEKDKTEKLYNHVKSLNKDLYDSMNYAGIVQNSILPSADVLKRHLHNSFLYFKPKDQVGGDFYWIKEQQNKTILAIGDATGHGVSGAILSTLGVSLLNEIINNECFESSKLILEKLNARMIDVTTQNEVNLALSFELGLCIIDTTKRTIQIAGSNFPFILSVKKQLKLPDTIPYCKVSYTKKNNNYIYHVKFRGATIGADAQSIPYTELSFRLNESDCVYLYSDGLVDQFGGELGKKMKKNKLIEFVSDFSSKSINKQEKLFHSTIDNWKANYEQVDDITFFGFSF